MPPFKDENVLIFAPGSQTTLAQLGLPESFTPASHRFPTRVFLAPDGKTYEPYKIRSKKKEVVSNDTDLSMAGTGQEEEEDELYEDLDDDESAIYPLKEGRIVNKEAFFALLEHIWNILSPNRLVTPIMLIAQPAWTAQNHEEIAKFIFDCFQAPALCIMDSALATSYAFGIPSATVIDVGYEKVDITAVTDFQISARGTCHKSGGEAMTRRLEQLLKSKSFTRNMAEQLKKSSICEILTPGTPLPDTGEIEEVASNLATAASTGAGPDLRSTEPPRGADNDIVEDNENGEEKPVDDDGVLDVASIVTSGKTQEFLAKKEREKAERAAAKRATKEAEKADAAAAAARSVKLPNSKRPRAMFHYDEVIKDAPDAKRQKTPEPAPVVTEDSAAAIVSEGEVKSAEAAPASGDAPVPVEDDSSRRGQQKAARKEERRKIREVENPDRIRRDIEIGTERFQAASEGFLDNIADTIYRTVLSVDEISKRQDAWDSLVICGSGSKVKGFKDALVTTLNNRYLVSPSSATIFMSELPSNLATPSGTGSMTPNASFLTPHLAPSASAVNPLLLAATTASNPALNPGLSTTSFHSGPTHSSHSQSPTSIKIASPPSYFPEWKLYEEAVFLGSQVAAKVIFVVDQGISKGFLTRAEFNEEGPTAVHQVGFAY